MRRTENMYKNYRTTCSHCNTGVILNLSGNGYTLDEDADDTDGYNVLAGFCPSCNHFTVLLEHGNDLEYNHNEIEITGIDNRTLIYPQNAICRNLDLAIPERYKKNYQEAEIILPISPKASATLSRYLLQLILHEELKIVKRNLEDEIKELEEKQIVSSKLSKMLQVMRKVANFGAHPKKSTNSNEIVEVENGEAEVMLDLLEELFDCVFVKPKQQKDFLSDIKDKYGIEV